MVIIDYLLIGALLFDLLFGDPEFIPHPVILMGRLISLLEVNFRKLVKSSTGERIAGLIEVLIVASAVYLLTFYVIKAAYGIHYLPGVIVNLYLLQSTVAIRGLTQAGNQVYEYLKRGHLILARKAAHKIVGRDCESLPEKEVIRATVESLAENTSDGILAPILFYLLGGTPLAMAYKAVNTMDSMLGYKNERYRYYGWAAARLDDLVNLVPARMTGICFCLAAIFTGQDLPGALQTMLRDARKHPSPNAGYPEGAVAGALGVRLGGMNYYHGQASFRAYLGQQTREFNIQDIKQVRLMVYWNVAIFIFIIVITRILTWFMFK